MVKKNSPLQLDMSLAGNIPTKVQHKVTTKDTKIVDKANKLFSQLETLDLVSKVEIINAIRKSLSKHSPFHDEPVDCVQWISTKKVIANDYNPNIVAPPEMKLLEHSIREDHFTQPIVSWVSDGYYEVIDGFHRNRVGRECQDIKERLHGYLPLSVINDERLDRSDRIAATIRHNRARGKHQITGMSNIVVELKRRNWSDKKIGSELGMEPDEVLRLCQITGLAEMFTNREFSEAWEVEESNNINETDTLEITEESIDATKPRT